MRKAVILSLLWSAAMPGYTGAAEPGVTLVADGRPHSVIVVPSKASRAATEGARVLSEHLFEMSGTRLKVLKEIELGQVTVVDGRIEPASAKAVAKTFILVGEGELTEKLGASSKGLGPGGILIRTVGNALVLLGPDDNTPSDPWGSRYAVTTFMEDALGCRYLWPGQSGKVIPRRKTIVVGAINMRFTPLLKQRNIRWSGYSSRIQEGLDRLRFSKEEFLQARDEATKTQSQDPGWVGWHRMGGTLGLRTGDGTILSAQAWETFLKEHPEWLAMQADGSRYFDPSWERPRLCKSNLALIKAIIQEKLKELRRNPGQTSTCLMTNDGGSKAGFCMCDTCKAMDPPDGRLTNVWTYNHGSGRTMRFDYVSLTDRMLAFYNAVAQKVSEVYPDVLFTGQAYSIYAAPPLREKLHPKIVIRFVHSTEHYASDELREQGMADWDAWASAARMIYYRPNSLLWGRQEGTTGVFARKMADDFRHIAHNKCVGTDFDSCIHHWATQGLNYYVLAKLHWNPDLDIDEVADDYCQSGFAQAAGPVKRYFAKIERLTDEAASITKEQRGGARPDVTEPYMEHRIGELRSLLDEADKAAGSDTHVRKRISFLRTGLDFTELQARIYRHVRHDAEKRLTEREKEEARRLLDEKWLIMRRIFREEHFAVNVSAMCWGEWGRFKRLGWEGPSQQTVSSAAIEQ
ncbi:MAG: DUF4838 domain-containing protein [Planctomycetota bacterium]